MDVPGTGDYGRVITFRSLNCSTSLLSGWSPTPFQQWRYTDKSTPQTGALTGWQPWSLMNPGGPQSLIQASKSGSKLPSTSVCGGH